MKGLTDFGVPTTHSIPFCAAKGDRLERVLSPLLETTRNLGQLGVVSGSELDPESLLKRLLGTLVGFELFIVKKFNFITSAPHPPWSPTRGHQR